MAIYIYIYCHITLQKKKSSLRKFNYDFLMFLVDVIFSLDPDPGDQKVPDPLDHTSYQYFFLDKESKSVYSSSIILPLVGSLMLFSCLYIPSLHLVWRGELTLNKRKCSIMRRKRRGGVLGITEYNFGSNLGKRILANVWLGGGG